MAPRRRRSMTGRSTATRSGSPTAAPTGSSPSSRFTISCTRAWLGLDAWLHPKTIDHFVTFVEHTVRYFLRTLPEDFGCAPPRWFITLNEPNLQGVQPLSLPHFSPRAALALGRRCSASPICSRPT